MRKFEQQIGSIHNLVVFEAAARHLSFSRAAAELSVTQPAVSQSVRKLEAAIGAQLFVRLHRSIALTDAGQRLLDDVTDAFDRISATVRQVGRAAADDHVKLLVSTAFATWWLVPRLASLHRLHPEIDLRLETVDRDIDFAQVGNTLAVRRGDGNWIGYDSALIAPERLFPIASPAFLRRHGTVRDLDHLLRLPMIHLDEPHRYRPTWAEFLASLGHHWRDRGIGLRLNDYALVIQAAQAGEGVALGWQHICERPIEQGLLNALETWQHETGAGFFIVWSSTTPLSRKAQLTRDWMIGGT